MLIYLILAAQFESFMDPLIIMFTVPLAIAGAVLSLWLFGQTLNIFSQIGMIMLIGLVTKNGILIVEYSNHIRDKGATAAKAALYAASMRFTLGIVFRSCVNQPYAVGYCDRSWHIVFFVAVLVHSAGDVYLLIQKEVKDAHCNG